MNFDSYLHGLCLSMDIKIMYCIKFWHLWKFQILISLLDKSLKFDDEIHGMNFVLVIFFSPLFLSFVISIT